MPGLNIALQRRDSKKPRLRMAAQDAEARRQQDAKAKRMRNGLIVILYNVQVMYKRCNGPHRLNLFLNLLQICIL